MKRSYLFVPGNRPERFAKGIASGAGGVVFDLEDAVQPEEKLTTRSVVCSWLTQRQDDAPNVWVRVNSVDTEYFEEDMRSVAAARPLGIMLPKTESIAVDRKFNRTSLNIAPPGGHHATEPGRFEPSMRARKPRLSDMPPFSALPAAALPRSVGQTAVAFPHQLTR